MTSPAPEADSDGDDLRPSGTRRVAAPAKEGPDTSDTELLLRLRGGDRASAAQIYQRHASMLTGLSSRIARGHGEAEDVLHNAFVTMHDRAARYAPEGGSPVGWLIALVRNLSIDSTRRRDRRGLILRRAAAERGEHRTLDPEMLLVLATMQSRVRLALATLPETQRATLELAFFEGLTYPEVALRQRLPLGTVKSRVARALASLREVLAAER